ncbi:SRPBCC family protein [Amycolatopsis palatopharyngis]|uniref:SRPBCC family protein n=1 Tax=Amycolatopsis palatopharyngis TaxID=187982 RepID=UPI000E237AC7|nr:SRPBCC family protein [Amycolatopsis palatopharyngis]
MRTARLETLDGNPVLRFERRLAHSPEKVWRAVSDPGEMAHWFPALIEAEPHAGARMRFSFPGEEEVSAGEVLEFDPPKVYAFRWNTDVLRFEILPEEKGCVLVFTHVLGQDAGFTAGRSAAGWDICLAALADRLDGREAEPVDHRPIMAFYLTKWNLAGAEMSRLDDGFRIRCRLDLVWRPIEQVWSTLCAGEHAEPGQTPPERFTVAPTRPGSVFEVNPPHELAYRWPHEGDSVGEVRWQLVHDPELATYVELTQTLPSARARELPAIRAAWQIHLERLFATLLGVEQESTTERVQDLLLRYEQESR